MENTLDVISILKEDIYIQGKPIKEHKLYKDLSDMNVSAQCISDYSNSLHNFKKVKGIKEAEKRVLTIFRINPLVAVRIIKSCSMTEDIYMLEYAIKPIFSDLRRDINFDDARFIINDNRIPYVILLIEAVFQNSISFEPRMFLEHAEQEDAKLHKKGIKAKYFNAYNIKHILYNIPENRQIEFVNWFWNKHCYAVKKFNKVTSFAGSRVSIIMKNMPEGSIWRHLENVENAKLSERERKMLNHEQDEICVFIKNVFEEGRHMEFVEIILGKDDFYKKLDYLMGNTIFSQQYSSLCDKQRIYEKKAEQARQRAQELKQKQNILVERKANYAKLVSKVRNFYLNCVTEDDVQWHMLDDTKNPQINLWSYWQGMNFTDVNIMVLGYDWGSVNDRQNEMVECLRKIQIMMKGKPSQHIRYCSCSYKKTDDSLEKLFDKCFGRKIRKQHYEDLFFSNLYLGYRKNLNSQLRDEMVLDDINKYMKDELSIVSPKVIFCLGEKVYKLFVTGIELMQEVVCSSTEYDAYKKSNITFEEKDIIVYCLPHCGVAGLKSMNINEQLKVWKMVKQDMESNNVIV